MGALNSMLDSNRDGSMTDDVGRLLGTFLQIRRARTRLRPCESLAARRPHQLRRRAVVLLLFARKRFGPYQSQKPVVVKVNRATPITEV